MDLSIAGGAAAGVQWTLSYVSADLSLVGLTAGEAANVAGKSLTCNNTATFSTCLVAGLSANLIGDGVIATYTFAIAPAPADGPPSRTTTLQFTNAVSASAAGDGISTSAIGGTGTILNPQVSVSPPGVGLSALQIQAFSPSKGVSWSMFPAVGSLSASGVYTAPVLIPARQVVTVTATSVADPTRFASAVVTLLPVTVGVSPSAAALGPSQSQLFLAAVTDTGNPAVTWSVTPLVGSISNAGLYTVPPVIEDTQVIAITARSVADPAKSADAAITLNPAPGITLSPAAQTLTASQQQQFSARVRGLPGSGINWATTPSIGSISTSGLYTAPASIATTQSLIITASSTVNPSVYAIATVILNPQVLVSITPASISLTASGKQQFIATVSGTPNPAVVWTMSPAIGSLSPAGLYTAPALVPSAQTVLVIATSLTDPSKSASATVSLVSPFSVTVSPLWAAVSAGSSGRQFTATVGGGDPGVAWSVTGGGTISPAGLYTSPAAAGALQIASVRASSLADATASGTASVGLLSPEPATFDNTAFLKRLFQDFLSRTPDPSELSSALNALTSGVKTRAQTALQLFDGAEFQSSGLYVAKAYTAILGRDPEFGGWIFWSNQMRGGVAQSAITNLFITSPEFQQTYGALTDVQFIQLVYQNVLGRPAETAGLNFWVSQTPLIGRAQIMQDFVVSAEYAIRIRSRQLANLAYLAFLAKTPEPGRALWTGALDQGLAETQFLDGIIYSADYRSRF